jgi:hypothetical protein
MSLNHLLLDADRELVIRYVPEGAEPHVLERLARMDSARPPTGPVLLAELSGVAVAARALRSGAVVADPFTPTADAVALLDMRARQIAGDGARRGRVGSRLAAAVWPRRRARAI